MPHVAAGVVRRPLDYDRRVRMAVPSTRARLDSSVRAGRARRAVEHVAASAIAIDVAILGMLTAATAIAYVWTDAPLYNQLGTIDPWLYTALWTNFDQVYSSFHGLYYISRVPWIVPGYVLNGFLDARAASLVLHTTFFLAGGVLLYVLCRRWLGRAAAAAGYVALIGNQMYFNAHRWDYQEGGVLTFMIAAYAFSLPRTESRWLRAASMALGGFFAAAMVTTRVIDVAWLLGLPLLYVAVNGAARHRETLARLGRDAAAFAAGALVLLVAGGIFARSHGEEFFFFMPQVRIVRSTSGGYNQLPVDAWFPGAAYYWVPLFALVFALAVVVLGPRQERAARRFLVAATAWLGFEFVVFSLWQFAGSGWLLNVTYYFSSFLVPTLLCLAAAVGVLVGTRTTVRTLALVSGACALAVLAPLVWVYGSDSPLRVAADYGDDAYVALAVAMGLAIALVVLLVRVPRIKAAVVAAVTIAFFASAYGVDASNATFAFAVSDHRTGPVYDVGQQLIHYLRDHGYEEQLPYFWYDGLEQAYAIGSIQSLYYSGYTFVDSAMPKVGETFRSRFDAFKPARLVLLCGEPGCRGGPRALERAGYRTTLRAGRLLRSEDFRLWVRIYGVSAPGAAAG
jgi:hypothetical protein